MRILYGQQICVDSTYVKPRHSKLRIVKTGILKREFPFSDELFSASRYAAKGMTPYQVEQIGILAAYSQFGSSKGVIYFNDCLDVINDKFKLFPSELAKCLHYMSRWEREMMIADSIAKHGVRKHVKIPKEKEWTIVVKQETKLKSKGATNSLCYKLFLYYYGNLYCKDPRIVSLPEVYEYKDIYPNVNIICDENTYI